MPYPTYVLATLVRCGSNSCGNLCHVLGLLSGASPAQYRAISGEGVFYLGRCTRVDLGDDQYTWELRVKYTGAGPCNGDWLLRLVTPADDPEGDYGLWVGGEVDPDGAQATVIATEL